MHEIVYISIMEVRKNEREKEREVKSHLIFMQSHSTQ